MSPSRAMRVVAAECLRHLQANLPGARLGADREFVHQARVALRRLRCAWKILPPSTRALARSGIAEDLKWLASVLGQARDLDVLLDETLPAIEAAADEAIGFDALRRALRLRADVCRREARAALDSARCAGLLSSLQAWLDEKAEAEGDGRLLPFAQQVLRGQRRRLCRLARGWKILNPEQRHDLRKEAKTLRYAAEFFASLYGDGEVSRYLSRLQHVQQGLGEMNDGVAARRLLAQCRAEGDGELARAAGFVDGWLAHAASQAKGRLGQALERLEQAGRFW
ncbi:hypothetical protein BI347_04065 [Chromobacterium sphagni]|uniref:CHAD domain-containing protein n=2 Tax=Chromobacterium sphagni TaxID=1903179 RepID=A0A1S1X019_9NEIS|nr:hypothetical protein BI347_04065 [Chromobacterium sphagni]